MDNQHLLVFEIIRKHWTHDLRAKETAQITSLIEILWCLIAHTNMPGFNLQGFSHLLNDTHTQRSNKNAAVKGL